MANRGLANLQSARVEELRVVRRNAVRVERGVCAAEGHVVTPGRVGAHL